MYLVTLQKWSKAFTQVGLYLPMTENKIKAQRYRGSLLSRRALILSLHVKVLDKLYTCMSSTSTVVTYLGSRMVK